MAKPIVVISKHENGFWCADYYTEPPDDCFDEWPLPDGWCSGKTGGTEGEIRVKANMMWPGVPVELANDD